MGVNPREPRPKARRPRQDWWDADTLFTFLKEAKIIPPEVTTLKYERNEATGRITLIFCYTKNGQNYTYEYKQTYGEPHDPAIDYSKLKAIFAMLI